MIVKTELLEWVKNSAKVSLYVEGLEKLRESGVLSMIRRDSIPSIGGDGGDINKMAGKAFWLIGFQEALDRLEYFLEIYGQQEEASGSLGLADFGALDSLVRDKVFTEAEAKAYRNKYGVRNER